MSSIVFTDQITKVPSSWLNDLNTVAFTYFGDGSNLNSPTKLTVQSVVGGAGTNLQFGGGALGDWIGDQSTRAIRPLIANDNAIDIGASNARIRTGYFGTSVVTPLVGPTTAVDLALQTNGTARWLISQAVGGGLVPNSDNAIAIGLPANRVSAVFTPIIDSGTTGSLSLKTNNGKQQALIVSAGDGTNFANIQGGGSPFSPVIFSNGGDTNVGLIFSTKGSGSIDFTTGGTFSGDINSGRLTQAQVLHTAGATRAVTLTGSNGGNPTIAATAGSPAIVYAGAGGSGTPTNHTLAMYEEGTWIPTLGGTATYTVQSGSYTRVGNLVFIRCRLTVNAIGTGNTTTISGLPFTASTSCPVSASNSLTLATAVVSLSPVISGTSIQVNSRVAANATDGTSAIFGAGTSLDIGGSYIV